jgi:Transglutaminase-like superfamily
MPDWAKLRALTGAEKRTLIVALATLPVVALGLATFGYGKTHSLMARWPRPKPSRHRGGPEARAKAESVARVVAVAASRGPVRVSCLRRSLVTWWLLRAQGVETRVRVGLGGSDVRDFNAHAWVEHEGRPVGETADVAERYPAFDRDFGATADRPS